MPSKKRTSIRNRRDLKLKSGTLRKRYHSEPDEHSHKQKASREAIDHTMVLFARTSLKMNEKQRELIAREIRIYYQTFGDFPVDPHTGKKIAQRLPNGKYIYPWEME